MVSGVSSSCGARGGFLPRHDEDLWEPLVRRQGSQVSMLQALAAEAGVLAVRGREAGRGYVFRNILLSTYCEPDAVASLRLRF